MKCDFVMADAHAQAGHVICKLADEKKADAIIMGQRRLGTLSRKLLGSTSDYVVHHAKVPILVAPTPQGEDSYMSRHYDT